MVRSIRLANHFYEIVRSGCAVVKELQLIPQLETMATSADETENQRKTSSEGASIGGKKKTKLLKVFDLTQEGKDLAKLVLKLAATEEDPRWSWNLSGQKPSAAISIPISGGVNLPAFQMLIFPKPSC